MVEIYKYKIKNFKKFARLKLSKQNLYIFTDTHYIAMLDLKFISESGIFFVNEYFISTKKLKQIDFVGNLYKNPNIEVNFLSFDKVTYLFVKNEFLQDTNSFVLIKVTNNNKIDKLLETKGFADSNDIITIPLTQNKSENWNYVILYFFLVIKKKFIVWI